MKEFPVLRAHGDENGWTVEGKDSQPGRMLSMAEVEALYNELRQAYLDVQKRYQEQVVVNVSLLDKQAVSEAVAHLASLADPDSGNDSSPRIGESSAMKEFPELYSKCGAPLSYVLAEPDLTGADVLHLYNELRRAYLGACCIVQDAITRMLVSCSSDPRLPGENRIPMEPGLYMARLKQDPQWQVAEVYGMSPYLHALWYKDREGCWLSLESIYFGPRLAGPDWRQVAQGERSFDERVESAAGP